jgi:hypothetical protein
MRRVLRASGKAVWTWRRLSAVLANLSGQFFHGQERYNKNEPTRSSPDKRIIKGRTRL